MNEEQLLEYLQEIIIQITERIGEKDLTVEEEQSALIEEISALLRSFDVAVDEVIPQMIIEQYFGGVDEANALLIAAGVSMLPMVGHAGGDDDGASDSKKSATERNEGKKINPASALTKAGLVSKAYQKPIHLNAVEELLDDTFMDLKAAIRTAEENAITTINDTIKQVKGDITKGVIVGDPRKVMQSRVAKSFSEGGLTAFKTVDGKSLPLDFYSSVVTRTKMRTAANTGAAKRYEESEQDLVKLTGNGDSCAVCARYRNLVVSLTGKTESYPIVGENGIRIGPFHPNCRCGVIPFVARFKTEDELAEAKKRNGAYDPEKDPRTPAQKRAYEREQAARRVANAEKKQFMRFNQVLGADNYKTLGAFRRAKRENTPKFQELQSNYRSMMQTKNGE